MQIRLFSYIYSNYLGAIADVNSLFHADFYFMEEQRWTYIVDLINQT
jgi:hypothetical protein